MSAKLVPTFADRGYRVVSATDPHGRILGCLDRKAQGQLFPFLALYVTEFFMRLFSS
jgi:hypothetical protein